MSELTVGQLYERDGQTEFENYARTHGNFGLQMAGIRYRWDGTNWVSEVLSEPSLIAGGGTTD